jgi:hypothetical protein
MEICYYEIDVGIKIGRNLNCLIFVEKRKDFGDYGSCPFYFTV